MKTCSLNDIIVEKLDDRIYEKYIKLLTDNKKYKLKKHEIECIKKMLGIIDLSYKGKANYYYSFNIPKIGKEMDLLKLDDKNLIDIELKSTFCEDDIKKQLIQNSYYLSFLPQKNKKIYSFCAETSTFYKMLENNLVTVELSEVFNEVESIEMIEDLNLESLFEPINYLVSPLNNTEMFKEQSYFLTSQQEKIKKTIIALLNEKSKLIYIKGKAGTGKTLLLYDLARSISLHKKVCVVHCGILCKGHYELNKHFKNLEIISAKMANGYNFKKCSLIIIDESHRIHKKTLIKILSYVSTYSLNCILGGDDNQKLSKSEEKRNIENIIMSSGLKIDYTAELSKKIRTNPELSNFIQLFFDQSKIKKEEFKNVQTVFVDDEEKLKEVIKTYSLMGYQYISYTPSCFVKSKLNYFDKYAINTHEVIGQEFDKIIVHVDNNFYYSSNYKLMSKEHPNPDYIYSKLLFQALTRARKKIVIVVVNDITLLNDILKVYR